MNKLFALIAILLASPALAQPAPPSANDDARIEVMSYAAGGIFHIKASPDTVQTLLFASGDQIRSVLVSDPSAYTITVAGSGDALSLKPNGANVIAMVNVRTEQRSYDLEVTTGTPGPVPSIIRFSYGEKPRPALPQQTAAPSKSEGVEWKLSGSKALRPAEVSDDGTKTYITWRTDQDMPAVFVLGPGNSERMVDGYVRGGLFTIDRLHTSLIFRIDNEVARAERIKKRGRHERRRDAAGRSAASSAQTDAG
jgi:type IV secretion system protein VirB9